MLTESGYEYEPMTKEEADASVREMGSMMDFFEGTCELCGKKRMHCDIECVRKQIKE